MMRTCHVARLPISFSNSSSHPQSEYRRAVNQTRLHLVRPRQEAGRQVARCACLPRFGTIKTLATTDLSLSDTLGLFPSARGQGVLGNHVALAPVFSAPAGLAPISSAPFGLAPIFLRRNAGAGINHSLLPGNQPVKGKGKLGAKLDEFSDFRHGDTGFPLRNSRFRNTAQLPQLALIKLVSLTQLYQPRSHTHSISQNSMEKSNHPDNHGQMFF